MVDNAQLWPQVVVGPETDTGLKLSTFRSEGKYTMIASSWLKDINAVWMGQIT